MSSWTAQKNQHTGNSDSNGIVWPAWSNRHKAIRNIRRSITLSDSINCPCLGTLEEMMVPSGIGQVLKARLGIKKSFCECDYRDRWGSERVSNWTQYNSWWCMFVLAVRTTHLSSAWTCRDSRIVDAGTSLLCATSYCSIWFTYLCIPLLSWRCKRLR